MAANDTAARRVCRSTKSATFHLVASEGATVRSVCGRFAEPASAVTFDRLRGEVTCKACLRAEEWSECG